MSIILLYVPSVLLLRGVFDQAFLLASGAFELEILTKGEGCKCAEKLSSSWTQVGYIRLVQTCNKTEIQFGKFRIYRSCYIILLNIDHSTR